MRLFMLFIGLIMAGQTGCTLFNDSSSDETGLAGVWYKIDTLDISSPGPDLQFTGWEIELHEDAGSDAGTMHPIGINGNTGEIARIDEPHHIHNIHELNEDYFVMDRLVHPGGIYLDTLAYNISSHTLTLERNGHQDTYLRSRLGYAPIEGIKSHLSVSINGENSQNVQVIERPPSVFFRKTDGVGSSPHLELRSRLDIKQSASMRINFSYSEGPGTYVIGDENAFYGFRYGDLAALFSPDADSSGYITIDSFDTENNRITGSFAFSVSDSQGETRTFTNGTFDVPVYE